MKKLVHVSLVCLGSFLLQDCAGSSGGAGVGASQYQADLGVTTNIGFRQEVQRILVRKYHYLAQQFDESADRVYFETDWKDRLPFEDEKQKGVVQAKSRVILEGRSRVRTSSATLKVRFRGENQLLFQDMKDWEFGVQITPDCRQYFKKLANELKTEFSTRVRKF